MPELPEVETIKRELVELIKNKKIKSVDINLAKQVKMPKAKFLRLVEGQNIKNIRRRAKMIILDLASGWHLVFHLKMTGQLIYRGKGGKLAGGGHPIRQDLEDLPNKYSHVIFNFQGGSRLFFNDLRQFGWVKLLNGKELEKIDREFGVEPLGKEFTFKKFKELLEKKQNKVIKPLLLEQGVIAGIGNIYAQEACFCAGIMPNRRVKDIDEAELKKLYNCLIKILKLAVEKKGTSADNYVDAFGRQGSMVEYLKVYDRKGKKCYKCRGEIKVMKQGSRTTAYCGACQR